MKFGERDYFDIACFSYMAKTQKYDLKLADLSSYLCFYMQTSRYSTFILTSLLLLGSENQINSTAILSFFGTQGIVP
jgi:hypothetical protein